MSSEYLPARNKAIDFAGGMALAVALLTFGAAIGMTWVGTQVQATGCAGQFVSGACMILPEVSEWANNLIGIAVVGFIGAFAAEYHEKQREEDA